jgi:hypothetical protein
LARGRGFMATTVAADSTGAGRGTMAAGQLFTVEAQSDITADSAAALLYAAEAGSIVSPQRAADSMAEAASTEAAAAGNCSGFVFSHLNGRQLRLPAVLFSY